MSLALEAVRHKPDCFFLMDDSSPLQDYGPYNRSATLAGTLVKHPALVKGATYAPVVNNTNAAEFTTGIFAQGDEPDSFSLMATISPVAATTSSVEQKVLSHQSAYDGLTIKGTVVSFVTKYLTTGEARASYDLGSFRTATVIGVHTNDSNNLIVDGVLVSSVTISPEQKLDSFVATNGKLYSGTSTQTQGFAINGVGVYGHALTEQQITSLSGSNLLLPSVAEIAAQFNGTYFPMSRATSNVFVEQWWQTEEDWKSATLDGVVVKNAQLVPQFDGDVSIPGKWIDNFSLSSADTTSIYGVAFDWDGTGATVEASLDAVTWVPVTKGVNVSIIPPGFNPTDKQLLVRISFPGGITDDPAYLDNLNAVGTKTATTQEINGRTITLTNAYHQKDFKPMEFDENWGVQIDSGGSVVLSASTEESPVLPRTIELWIKRTSSTVPTVSVSGTQYKNGTADATSITQGQWTLLHIVSATDITGAITITGPAQVGAVVTYPTSLSAGEVSAISNAYSGANSLRIGDNSVLTITQPGDNANIYAHDWSILSAG